MRRFFYHKKLIISDENQIAGLPKKFHLFSRIHSVNFLNPKYNSTENFQNILGKTYNYFKDFEKRIQESKMKD